MRRNIYAGLLVVLFQLLWVAAESEGWKSPGNWDRRALKVSVGFPVPCASYTAVRTTGDMPSWQNYPDRSQWLPGHRVSGVPLALDALAVVAAFFGFRCLLRYQAGRAASAGFALGIVFGVMGSLLAMVSWSPASEWIIALLFLMGLPTAICYLTRHARSVWLPLLMLAVAVLVMPWMSARVEYFRADHGFSFAAEGSTIWSPSLEDMLFVPLMCVAVLSVLVLLIRRFVPVFRKHETVA